MAQEIERKFLVLGDAWRKLAEGMVYRQGYLVGLRKSLIALPRWLFPEQRIR